MAGDMAAARPLSGDIASIQIDSIAFIGEAAALLSEHGENPEYDRAIVELTTATLGLSVSRCDQVHQFLRLLADSTFTPRKEEGVSQ